MIEILQQWDWDILYAVAELRAISFLDTLMPFVSRLGDAGFIWIAAGVALLCTRRYRKVGIAVLLGLAVGVLIGNVALKNIIARPRPCWLQPEMLLLAENPADYSFPSGHTLSSVIAATVLLRGEKRFAWGAVPLAALIALSRLYLFVHFPSDILGGAVLGAAIGWITYEVILKIKKKKE